MVDWKSPQTLALDSLAILKVAHFMIGVYVWDWILGLPFEYRLVTRKQGWKSPVTISVYLACRLFAFGQIVTSLVIFNAATPLDCNVWLRLIIAFSNAALALSSILIGLRTIAIWRHHKVVMVVTLVLLATSVAFLTHGAVVVDQVYWDPQSQSCGLEVDAESLRASIAANFSVDCALIAMMLLGSWKYKGSGSLWRLVFHQGIIWAIVALLCYIPSVVLINLDLNPALNLIAGTPTAISMILCTTTMQRTLSEHAYPTRSKLPSVAVSRSIKFRNPPAPSSLGSQTGSDISSPQPAFIAMDGIMRSRCDPSDDTANKYVLSTIV